MQTHAFRDFDAFASSVRDVDSTMMLQNPKRRIWMINQVYLPGVHVQMGRLGSGNIVEGQSFSHGYVLYLPLTDACAYVANGTVLEQASFMVLEPGCEFCLSTKDEHDWFSIFIPSSNLARGGDLVEPSSGSEEARCRATPANRQAAKQAWAFVSQIVTAAAICPQFEPTPAAACVAAELLKVASSVIGGPQTGESVHEGRPRFRRSEIIRRSQELLEERRGERVSVEELAATAKVSERTLRAAFNEYYGVGPLYYLQLKQLHQVHRSLRAADPEAESVTDVLLRHGEWEFGRFASRYRRLFGELPSETLGTKSGRGSPCKVIQREHIAVRVGDDQIPLLPGV